MAVTKPKITTTYKLTKNIKTWGKYSPVYIVIHFTGGFNDSIGGMLSCFKSYNDTGSNAHYLVGNADIWEMVNPKMFYCYYSCGSRVGKKSQCIIPGWGPGTYTGPLSMSHAAIAGHTNTINVEICSCKTGRKVCDPMDDGWYFSDGAYINAVKLCAWLCDEFGIKVSNIIMHNQVTGKICPAMWCNHSGAEAGFDSFKQSVALLLNEVDEDTPIKSTAPIPNGGSILVAADSIFHSRPSSMSPVVYQSENEATYEYTTERNGYYYTSNGWVNPSA